MEIWSMGKLVEVYEKHIDQLTTDEVRKVVSILKLTNILGLDPSAEIRLTARMK